MIRNTDTVVKTPADRDQGIEGLLPGLPTFPRESRATQGAARRPSDFATPIVRKPYLSPSSFRLPSCLGQPGSGPRNGSYTNPRSR